MKSLKEVPGLDGGVSRVSFDRALLSVRNYGEAVGVTFLRESVTELLEGIGASTVPCSLTNN